MYDIDFKHLQWISVGVVIIDGKNKIGHCYSILERTNESDINQIEIHKNYEYIWARGKNIYAYVHYSYDTDSERLRFSMKAWILAVCKHYKVYPKFERE